MSYNCPARDWVLYYKYKRIEAIYEKSKKQRVNEKNEC